MRYQKLIRYALLLLPALLLAYTSNAQSEEALKLYQKLKQKIDLVRDYEADVSIKVNVTFIKMPLTPAKLYFKYPDKIRIVRQGGISVLPRKGISITMNKVVPESDVTVLDAGTEKIGDQVLRILKVIPNQQVDDIVLSRIWVDEEQMLIRKAETTTRDNGTYTVMLEYGKYIAQALPDKVKFIMDVKDFKLPKGVTMDYETGSAPPPEPNAATKRKYGNIEIYYRNYKVNAGVSDAVFTQH